jgi:hypothetical protein
MAFTEAQLVAQLDSASTGRTINIETLIPGPTITDVYAVGITAPYTGRSRWVQVTSSNTAAQAASQIQTALS